MPPAELPTGAYLTCTWGVKPDGGGQTRAMLARNRMIHNAGASPTILSFVPVPDLDDRRAALFERGQLLPGMQLESIYDYYRGRDWADVESNGEPLADLSEKTVAEEHRPDGTPWRVTYKGPRPEERIYDYLRSDGTTYLRVPRFSFSEPASWPRGIQKVSRDGTVVGRFGSLGQWFRGWVRAVAATERAFVFLETRVLTPHLVPMKAPNIHLIQVMHNIHVQLPQRWDSPVTPLGQILLDRINDLDAVVNLTERQREDISLRRGATNNLFVVPNPVEMPRGPLPAARDPRLATVVARLAGQKRLSHAVAAFEKVLERVPDARLEIFGDGPDRKMLQSLVERRGLTGSVILKGYDPQARATLSRSSAFLMTSRNEGYPLSTLESLSHGCPVVSYDIKYGPREQITDGVNGYLVPDGDTVQMAARVVHLLESPDLVARLSRAAVERARQHGSDRYRREWAHVLQTVARQKSSRTTIRSAQLEVSQLEVGRPAPLSRLQRRGSGSPTGACPDDAVLSFRGVLRVDGRGAPETLDRASIELSAVREISGEVVALPVTVARKGKSFEVAAQAKVGDLVGAPGKTEKARMRLRLVWQNSAWDVYLGRPIQDEAPQIEVLFEDGEAMVVRRPPDPRPQASL